MAAAFAVAPMPTGTVAVPASELELCWLDEGLGGLGEGVEHFRASVIRVRVEVKQVGMRCSQLR
jgi:hypothetical protein